MPGLCPLTCSTEVGQTAFETPSNRGGIVPWGSIPGLQDEVRYIQCIIYTYILI